MINTLENIRLAIEELERTAALGFLEHAKGRELLGRAANEIDDAVAMLAGGGLHPEALAQLNEARRLVDRATKSLFNNRGLARDAIKAQERARALLVEVGP